MEMNQMSMTSNTPASHFWYPLSPRDLWKPFVYCMMTVIDEIHDESKYYHILAVEFYEWIARIALIYHQLKTGKPLG